MEIELKNFKIWSYKKLNLTEGLTLFEGMSGIGKSSILEAIVFAITGKGKHIIKTNMTSCRVKISLTDIVIIRNKRPNNLEITFDNKHFIDEEAQSYINIIFTNLFSSIGYIKQGASETFIDKSSSEKFFMLELLAFNGLDIIELKKRLLDRIKNFKSQFLSITSKLEVLEKTVIHKPEIEFSTDFHEDMKPEFLKKKQMIDKNLNGLQSRISDLEKEYLKSKNLEGDINTCTELISTFQGQLDMLPIEDEKILSSKLAKYSNALERIQMQEAYNNCLLECQKLKEKIKKEEQLKLGKILKLEEKLLTDEELQNTKDVIIHIKQQEKLNKELERLIKEKKEVDYRSNREGKTDRILGELTEDISSLQKHLQKLKIQQAKLSCPSCQIELSLSNNNLVIYDDDVMCDKEYYSEVKKKVKKKEGEKIERVKIKERYVSQRLKTIMIDDSIKDLESQKFAQIMANIEDLEKKLNDHSVSFSILKELRSPIDTSLYDETKEKLNTLTDFKIKVSEEKLEKLTGSVEKYRKKLEVCSLNKIRSIELDSLITKIEKKLEDMPEFKSSERIYRELTHYKCQLKKFEDKKQKNNELLLELERFLLYKSHIRDYDNQLLVQTELKKEEKVINNYIYGAETLNSLIKTNESKCLAGFINKLEELIQKYLDEFFIEDSMNIKIQRFKKKVSSELKPDINIILDYKGMTLSIDNLSGGELQKLKIATTLAFSTLFPTPFLLLDESTSNLDQTATSLVMNTIRKFHSNKIVVIIAHQTVQGLYDNILEI